MYKLIQSIIGGNINILVEHKKKIIAGIAAAFLAAFAVFYDGIVRVVTDTLITPEIVTEQVVE
jgi:hypothetical protein